MCFLILGCGAEPLSVRVPTGMFLGWETLPHRVSATELTASLVGEHPTIVNQNDGGDFGAIDTPLASYDTIEFSHANVVVEEISVEFVIEPPLVPGSPEDYLTIKHVTLPDSLNDSSQVVALVRGFRIDTDRYDSPPAFFENEDLPYDPALGYTTCGIGMGSKSPTNTSGVWSMVAFARNRLGIGDREDMNAAIGLARTWMRVDYLILGFQEDVGIDRAKADYTLSYPDFGSQTDHPHADPETQSISFPARPDFSVLGYGIQEFEMSINVDGLFDASCTPIHEEHNAWGQPVGGPGRYLKELTARLTDMTVQDGGGAQALFDLHISNSSDLNEIGNICAALSGQAVLIRAQNAAEPTQRTREIESESGLMIEESLDE